MLDIGFDCTTENTAYFCCLALSLECLNSPNSAKFLFHTDPRQRAQRLTMTYIEVGHSESARPPTLRIGPREVGVTSTKDTPAERTRERAEYCPMFNIIGTDGV